MKITVIYDNEAQKTLLRSNWGFAALIEEDGVPTVLFDTGADGATLLHNMEQLGIDLQRIDSIVISHGHWDHTGGLDAILDRNDKAGLYVPASMGGRVPGRTVTSIGFRPAKICDRVHSTGELEGIEQALALETNEGIFVLTGCAHPHMKTILDAAGQFGPVYGIAGGFHGFRQFDLFNDLSLIYPCHCTQHKQDILDRFSEKAHPCGAGLVIEL
ncbi:MAG: MBL fold metallo-hydrolase [Chloroflexota bacterium]